MPARHSALCSLLAPHSDSARNAAAPQTWQALCAGFGFLSLERVNKEWEERMPAAGECASLCAFVCVCVGGANVENKKSEQLRFSQSDALMCIMIFSWDLKRIINNKNTWRTIEGAAKNVGVRLSLELGRRLSLRY